MTIKRWLLILVLIMATISVHSLAAQEPESPLVVFVVDDYLRNASVRDPGPYGLYQLEQVFISLGAQTDIADLRTPLPENADVVVLIGPKRRLPGLFVINLWTHLHRGNHLLLALDPPGQFGIETDRAGGTLGWLLDADFGITLQDSLVAEPWFTNSSIDQESTDFSRTYPEAFVQHPIVSPLVDYDLPVTIWGARSMTVEPIGIDSHAAPLLITHTAFGETNRQVFPADDTELVPVEFNPAEDVAGPLIVGALAENSRMGSRVAILGDAEIMQNGFGLSISSPPANPLHPGNRILAERLAAWLLGLPLESSDVYQNGFTSIVLDGNSKDWDNGLGAFVEVENDTTVPPEYAFQRVGLLRDSSYLYVAVETAAPPPANVVLKLDIASGTEDTSDTVVWSDTGAITMQRGDTSTESVPDGRQAISTMIEVRLPLRIIEADATVDTLCLTDKVSAETGSYVSCISPQLELGPATNTAPLDDARFTDTPLATVLSAQANLRTGPSINTRLITTLRAGQLLIPVGRNQNADWISVQYAAHEGWIATFLVALNTDVQTLPIVSSP